MSNKQPSPTTLQETMSAIRAVADAACDSAQEAGVSGAINWGDLGVVEVRFCVNEEGRACYDVLIEEAAPNCGELIKHVSEAVAKLDLFYPVEIRTEW